MKLLKAIIRFIIGWFRKRSTNYKFEFTKYEPKKISSKKIYLLKDEKEVWLAIMKCPCGCGNLIELNLLNDFKPTWKIFIDSNKKITLSPSIWRTDGCKSHFWMKKGRIVWS